jgi:hypothetical protein
MRALAVISGALGLLIATVPQFLLPVCSGSIETKAGRFIAMKCFWTGRAELAVGALIVLVSILLFFSRNRSAALPLNITLVGLGVVALLVPTSLIGVCMSPTMACRVGTLPGLVVLSSLIIVIGLAGIALSIRKESQPISWPAA